MDNHVSIKNCLGLNQVEKNIADVQGSHPGMSGFKLSYLFWVNDCEAYATTFQSRSVSKASRLLMPFLHFRNSSVSSIVFFA